ncbi:Antitoxin VapB32 [subsurface metagenome]
MRTTLNIEDKLIDKASKLTGVKEKTSLVESSRRLAKLGGTEKRLRAIRRRRSGDRLHGSR